MRARVRLLRYRKQIGAEHIAVWADVKKKHSAHAMTADVSLAETVKAAEFFGADAVIVTGEATGRETSTADLSSARGATKLAGHCRFRRHRGKCRSHVAAC